MRVMAIRASHEALIHPVFEGLGKLGANIVMAPITDLRLPFRQESPVGLGLMNGVAGCTANACLGMIAAADVGAICVLGMTTQTRIDYLVRG